MYIKRDLISNADIFSSSEVVFISSRFESSGKVCSPLFEGIFQGCGLNPNEAISQTFLFPQLNETRRVPLL